MLENLHGVQPQEETTTIPLSENGRAVLERRYLRRGPDGKPMETVEGMFERVARHIAAPEGDFGEDVGAAEQA